MCWLPFLIFYYPGISTGDTVDSLSQFFHLDTSWTKDTINLIDKNVYINKHHSVFFTITLGMIVSLGNKIASYNVGYYLYILIQTIILLVIFGYMNCYFKKIKIPVWIRNIASFYIGITPVIKAFAICAVKDTMSAIFILLYVLFLLQIVINRDEFFKNKKRVGVLILTMLLVMLYKNNGIYIVLLSFPVIFLLFKNNKRILKKTILIILLPFIIFFTYDSLILPSFKITNGSIKEGMTIPFMQLSRLANYNQDLFNSDEKNIINNVISFDSMVYSYNTDNADEVKDTYNKNVTDTELRDFFRIWFKYLKKYPNVYLASFINSTYKYIYPGTPCDKLYLIMDYRIERDSYFNLHQLDKCDNIKKLINCIENIIDSSPFTFFLSRGAFYTWFLIISLLLIFVKKQYKYLIPLLPLVLVFISCFAAPINGSLRYMLPIIFSIPVIITIDYLVLFEDVKIKNT